MFHVSCHLHPRPVQLLVLVSEPHIQVFIHFLPVGQLEMVIGAAQASACMNCSAQLPFKWYIYDNLDLVSFFLLSERWDALTGLKWWQHEDTHTHTRSTALATVERCYIAKSSHSPSGTDGNNTAWQQAQNKTPRVITRSTFSLQRRPHLYIQNHIGWNCCLCFDVLLYMVSYTEPFHHVAPHHSNAISVTKCCLCRRALRTQLLPGETLE